ncbi:GntR family transcriptional regulator [Falsiroseomonas ponticola]|uniref:GntR family transcriptional regulator n=1 Tax=Falsiroseomonas ponticola TaxID=2786951 RepID=UPI00193229DA|nr:GntR family transcriptional regulator [Roseomonas ponticola]
MAGDPHRLVGVINAANRPRAEDADAVHAHLFEAIVDQRLPPGTKLTERSLVETFDLGRRAINDALKRLVWERLAVAPPNRGVFVAAPDAEEARAIFAARRAIEGGCVEAVARGGSAADANLLLENLAEEHRLRRAGRVREAIRLSGGFHTLVARLSGNPILEEQVRLLVARTSLVVALYEDRAGLACWHDDHEELVALIRARRHRAAVTLMQKHLADIERGLRLDRPSTEGIDIRLMLARSP